MLDLGSLVSFLVLGIIGWFTYKVYICPYYISPLRIIPGPPSDNPIYGNFRRFFLEGVNIALYINLIDSILDLYLFHFLF